MIEINNTTAKDVDRAMLRSIAKGIFQKEKIKNPELSVAIVGPRKAQMLNRAYRGKSSVPNVLSFRFKKSEGLGLGEVILCPQRISQDAKKYGITFKEELIRIFVHGLLHVLGYSHGTMKPKEKAYLKLFQKTVRA